MSGFINRFLFKFPNFKPKAITEKNFGERPTFFLLGYWTIIIFPFKNESSCLTFKMFVGRVQTPEPPPSYDLAHTYVEVLLKLITIDIILSILSKS